MQSIKTLMKEQSLNLAAPGQYLKILLHFQEAMLPDGGSESKLLKEMEPLSNLFLLGVTKENSSKFSTEFSIGTTNLGKQVIPLLFNQETQLLHMLNTNPKTIHMICSLLVQPLESLLVTITKLKAYSLQPNLLHISY